MEFEYNIIYRLAYVMLHIWNSQQKGIYFEYIVSMSSRHRQYNAYGLLLRLVK